MNKSILFFMAFSLLFGITSLNAQKKIAYCTQSDSDAAYVTFLESLGYIVDDTPYDSWSNLDATKAENLETYDLVIIARNTNSTHFDAAYAAVWQTVSVPVLSMSSYVNRNTRLKFFDTGNAGQASSSMKLDATVPGHVIFTGVTMTNDIFNTGYELNPVTTAGLGTVLGTESGTGYVTIAEWDAGAECYTGSGINAGKRMYFQGYGGLSLTADGLELFTNIVEYLIPADPIIELSSNSANEELPAGVFVGMLTTTNIESPVLSIYNDGVNDTDNALFTVVNDSLRTAGVLDFETHPTYTITVRAVGTPTTDKEFTITVNDINEQSAPITDITIDNSSVSENMPTGTKVGTLTVVDADVAETHILELIEGDGTNDADNAKFILDGSDLVLAESLDYETQKNYSVLVKADDGNNHIFIKSLTINAINQGSGNLLTWGALDAEVDADTLTLHASGATKSWADGELEINITDLGSAEYDVQMYFYDVAYVAGHSYTFSFDAYSTNPHEIAVIAGKNEADWDRWNTEDITTSGTTSNYSLTFTVAEEYATNRTGFRMGVKGVNAAPNSVFFDNFKLIDNAEVNSIPENLTLSSLNVNEGEKLIGIISADDPDEDATISYDFIAGTGDTDNALFEILNGNELNLKNAAVLGSSYSVRIKASDNHSASVENTFAITVGDVDDAPTDILLSANSIAENMADGSIIGTLSATDNDAGDTHSFALIDGDGINDVDNASFTISGMDLVINESPNFEVQNTFNIYLEVTDASGLKYQKALIVEITDENEAPTSLAISSNSFPEESPIGTFVGELSAIDPDVDDVITYSMAVGDGTNDVDNDKFSIDGSEIVTAIDGFDYESTPDAEFKVLVKAQDNDGLSTSLAIVLTLNDINEDNLAPTNISISHDSIAEGSSLNAFIGKLTTTDADEQDTHTYRFVEGEGADDNEHFAISNDSLLLNAELDYETKSRYTILIETDDKNLGFDTVAFSIHVVDVNEPLIDILISNTKMDENIEANSLIASLTAVDTDTTGTYTFELADGDGVNDADNGKFKINSTDLIINESPNFELQDIYFITLKVSDNENVLFKQVSLTVGDLDEAPTDISLSNQTIIEGKDAGSFIGLLTAVDEDENATFEYSLTASEDFIIQGDSLLSNKVFDFNDKSEYSIDIQVNDGVNDFSKTFAITITEDDAIGIVDNLLNAQLYPNPVSSNLNINLNENKGSTLYLYNMDGSLIQVQELSEGLNTVDVNLLTEGVYVAEIQGVNGEMYRSLIVKE